MKTTTKQILQATLNSDQSVTDTQRETALAVLDGKPAPIVPLLLKQGAVSELLGVSRQTVWALTKRGTLNPVKLTTGAVRYKRDEILKLAGAEA